MDIVDKVKAFVKTECKRPTSKYGYGPFLNHFKPTVDYAEKLSDKLGGDKEIILIAAWLHDIGSIIKGRKDHHITGAQIAEEKLREFNYPQKKIKLVKACILNHRGSQKNNRKTIEEKIVADADAMSNFDNLPGIFEAALKYENKTQTEAKESAIRKLQNKWEQLHFDYSKRVIKPKYKAAMLLLK
jgi:uncharacterized protein